MDVLPLPNPAAKPNSIRPAAEADRAEVSALLGRTWHATYDSHYGFERVADIGGRWHAIAALAKGRNDPDHCFLVALSQQHIVGTASASRSIGGAIKLDRLYVDPDYQGQGTGTALLEACLGHFPDAVGVALEVEPANAKAIAFYQRHGFAVTDTGNDCGSAGDGITHLVMERMLSAHAYPMPDADAPAQSP